MQLIPVLDLLNGVVVRGVAGRRDEYRPIQSGLTDSVEAREMARAIRGAYGFNAFYVADLDAILRGQPNLGVYREGLFGIASLCLAGARNCPRDRGA